MTPDLFVVGICNDSPKGVMYILTRDSELAVLCNIPPVRDVHSPRSRQASAESMTVTGLVTLTTDSCCWPSQCCQVRNMADVALIRKQTKLFC